MGSSSDPVSLHLSLVHRPSCYSSVEARFSITKVGVMRGWLDTDLVLFLRFAPASRIFGSGHGVDEILCCQRRISWEREAFSADNLRGGVDDCVKVADTPSGKQPTRKSDQR